MKHSQIKHFLALSALCTYLFLIVGQIQGLVLCFERNGHVALETSVNGICSDEWAQERAHRFQTSPTSLSFQMGRACKRCVDVPLSIQGAINGQSKVQASLFSADLPAVNGPPDVLIGYLALATQQLLPHPPPLPQPIHRYLSTIVLLI